MFRFIWLRKLAKNHFDLQERWFSKQNFARVSILFSVWSITKIRVTSRMKVIDLLSSLIHFCSNSQYGLGNDLSREVTGFSTFPSLLMLDCSAI